VRRTHFPGQAFQQAHRLEEVEAVRLAEEVVDQTKTRSPARGGHRRNSPSCRLVTATNRVKEFRQQYRARKRSSTLANRNRPPSEYLSSSKRSVTSTPWQKAPATAPWTRPTVRRAATSRMPSMRLRVSAESAKSYSLRTSRRASALPALTSDRW